MGSKDSPIRQLEEVSQSSSVQSPDKAKKESTECSTRFNESSVQTTGTQDSTIQSPEEKDFGGTEPTRLANIEKEAADSVPECPQTKGETPKTKMKRKTINKKRKRRRGRKTKSDKIVKDNDFKVYLVNVRGVSSKQESLKSIIDDPQVNPDVINLLETNLKKSKK